MFKRALSAALAVCLLLSGLPRAEAAGAPSLSAQSAILVDCETGRVLYAKNADEPRAIASITKLLTALVAVECQPDVSQTVTIRAEWTGAAGSSLYLKEGDTITLEGLLYGLLLNSGNDAAVAIAGYCAGDVDTFVDWMNQRASDIGMTNSHFVNPNGLSHEDHYSTAADMAKLARVVMDNEILARIVATKSITIDGRSFTNHNKLLWQYEGCVGMKTGYTDKAGRTLVSCAQRGEQRLIAVTLNDPNDWADHAALFDYGFSVWHRQVLALADRRVSTVPVSGSLRRFVGVITAKDVYYPLTAQERVTAKIVLPEQVDAPVEGGTIAGRITFYLEEQEIGETYLLYEDDVADDRDSGGIFTRIFRLFSGRGGAESPAAFWRSLPL